LYEIAMLFVDEDGDSCKERITLAAISCPFLQEAADETAFPSASVAITWTIFIILGDSP